MKSTTRGRSWSPVWQQCYNPAGARKRERPGARFFRYLVTDHSGTEEAFYRSQSVGLSSADRSRADGTHFGGSLDVEETRVPSTTLDDLLAREGIETIDLLALDIEGHEFNALRGIDLARFQPQLVVSEGRRRDVSTYLHEQGYEVIERYLRFDFVNTYYQRRAGRAVVP
ncbi:MAG: FkbM family methyltransferase [Myxococcota bacterium]|nr:FkbM family methyltransferase [Myxococcota bacterium]